MLEKGESWVLKPVLHLINLCFAFVSIVSIPYARAPSVFALESFGFGRGRSDPG